METKTFQITYYFPTNMEEQATCAAIDFGRHGNIHFVDVSDNGGQYFIDFPGYDSDFTYSTFRECAEAIRRGALDAALTHEHLNSDA